MCLLENSSLVVMLVSFKLGLPVSGINSFGDARCIPGLAMSAVLFAHAKAGEEHT